MKGKAKDEIIMMNREEAIEAIERVAKKVTTEVIKEVKGQEGESRKGRAGKQKKVRNTFEKTEATLYNYPKFKRVIEEREAALKDNSRFRPKGKSADIIRYSSKSHSSKDIERIMEENKCAYAISLERTKQEINRIDDALKKFEDDTYYGIIPAKYFEKKTHEEIAEMYGKDTSTITRNKNRLINELKIILFSDEAIKELLA